MTACAWYWMENSCLTESIDPKITGVGTVRADAGVATGYHGVGSTLSPAAGQTCLQFGGSSHGVGWLGWSANLQAVWVLVRCFTRSWPTGSP